MAPRSSRRPLPGDPLSQGDLIEPGDHLFFKEVHRVEVVSEARNVIDGVVDAGIHRGLNSLADLIGRLGWRDAIFKCLVVQVAMRLADTGCRLDGIGAIGDREDRKRCGFHDLAVVSPLPFAMGAQNVQLFLNKIYTKIRKQSSPFVRSALCTNQLAVCKNTTFGQKKFFD